MKEDGLTLEEISECCGVEPRTLRSWVSEGLLAPPFKSGRGARYPESNATRALAVLALKDIHGLRLADIRKKLMLVDEAQIREWATEVPTPASRASSAREYLERVRHEKHDDEPVAMSVRMSSIKRHPDRSNMSAKIAPAFSESRESVSPDPFEGRAVSSSTSRRARAEPDLANIERLLAALEVEVHSLPPRKARAQFWNRIKVTPDIELSVRGEMSPRERAMFERLADLIRTILTGGAQDDDHI